MRPGNEEIIRALRRRVPRTPYPDGDLHILACPVCGSGEYLHNEDGNEQRFCGQCGQAIDWHGGIHTPLRCSSTEGGKTDAKQQICSECKNSLPQSAALTAPSSEGARGGDLQLSEKERCVLRAYADCSCSKAGAARELNYSDHVVHYHLNKIRERTGLDPDNFWDLVKLMEVAGYEKS